MTNSGKHGALAKISYGFADIYGGGAFVVISTFYTVFLTKSPDIEPIVALLELL